MIGKPHPCSAQPRVSVGLERAAHTRTVVRLALMLCTHVVYLIQEGAELCGFLVVVGAVRMTRHHHGFVCPPYAFSISSRALHQQKNSRGLGVKVKLLLLRHQHGWWWTTSSSTPLTTPRML